MYHLKAYIQTLLNFDRDDGETILQFQGWRSKINSPVTYIANNVWTNYAHLDALSAIQQASIKLQKADARNYYAGGKKLENETICGHVSPRKMNRTWNTFGI